MMWDAPDAQVRGSALVTRVGGTADGGVGDPICRSLRSRVDTGFRHRELPFTPSALAILAVFASGSDRCGFPLRRRSFVSGVSAWTGLPMATVPGQEGHVDHHWSAAST